MSNPVLGGRSGGDGLPPTVSVASRRQSTRWPRLGLVACQWDQVWCVTRAGGAAALAMREWARIGLSPEEGGVAVAACEQDPSGLPTRADMGQEFMRIYDSMGQRLWQMSQHSYAKGLPTYRWANTYCEWGKGGNSAGARLSASSIAPLAISSAQPVAEGCSTTPRRSPSGRPAAKS
jgi:hypothetical protein